MRRRANKRGMNGRKRLNGGIGRRYDEGGKGGKVGGKGNGKKRNWEKLMNERGTEERPRRKYDGRMGEKTRLMKVEEAS